MEQAKEVSESRRLQLSPSVTSAKDRFPESEPISGAALVRAILDLHHSDYARGKASGLSLDEHGGTMRPVLEWLSSVRTLFDERAAPELHGRLVVIGLSLLEPSLLRQLQEDGFLDALVQELKEPLDELLRPEGRNLRQPADTVPNQPDDPLDDSAADQLGRVAFAWYLARRIFAIPPQSQAYSIHLYGPWGSGKSTLLNFLREELVANGKLGEQREQEDQVTAPAEPRRQSATADNKGWLVVTFNAWQHQHVQPPWWALMDHVFQHGKKELRPRHWLAEYWWRLSSGRLAFLVGIAVLAWLVAIFLPQLVTGAPEDADQLGYLGGVADAIGKILALIVTIWAGIQAASRPLFLRSARAAQSYTEATADPMNDIKRRFGTLIRRIPKRVAIFIDDLDRCQSRYVVELLEGVQTLFRESPVVFVVAADRRWLNACYEEVYAKLKPLVHEPGKPLGTLFLEKAFQFSTSVPAIPDELKREYWESLIQVNSATAPDLDAERVKAREVLATKKSEGEILDIVEHTRNRSFLEERAVREEAVKRLAAPEILERTEHVLRPLSGLLEHNPRTMKRLVNAYSANRALAILAHLQIRRDQLALWTILSLRWPQLADYLEEDPEMVEKIGQPDLEDVDEDLRPLFADSAVVEVVAGDSVNAALDSDVIALCARLRS